MIRDKTTMFGYVTEKGIFDSSSPDEIMHPVLNRYMGKFVKIEIEEMKDQRLPGHDE